MCLKRSTDRTLRVWIDIALGSNGIERVISSQQERFEALHITCMDADEYIKWEDFPDQMMLRRVEELANYSSRLQVLSIKIPQRLIDTWDRYRPLTWGKRNPLASDFKNLHSLSLSTFLPFVLPGLVNLRHLSWHPEHSTSKRVKYSCYDVVKLIQQNRQLETLELIELNLSERASTEPDDLSLVTLPVLHTLTIVGTAGNFHAYMSECLTMPALLHLSFKNLRATYETSIRCHTLNDLFTDSEKRTYNDLTASYPAPPTKLFVSSSSKSHSPTSLISYSNGDISIAVSVKGCWGSENKVHLPRMLQIANVGSSLEALWLRSFSAPNPEETLPASSILKHTPLLKKLVVLSATIAEAILHTLRPDDSDFYSSTSVVLPCPLLTELYLFYPWEDKYVVKSAPCRSEIEEFLEARQRAGHPLQRVYIYDSRPKSAFAHSSDPSLNAGPSSPGSDDWQMNVGDAAVYYCRAYPEDLKLDEPGMVMEPWVLLRRELSMEGHFLEGDEVFRWIPGNYELSDSEIYKRKEEAREERRRMRQQSKVDVEDAEPDRSVTDEENVTDDDSQGGQLEDTMKNDNEGKGQQQEAAARGEEQTEIE